jgi:hypothetical protein
VEWEPLNIGHPGLDVPLGHLSEEVGDMLQDQRQARKILKLQKQFHAEAEVGEERVTYLKNSLLHKKCRAFASQHTQIIFRPLNLGLAPRWHPHSCPLTP